MPTLDLLDAAIDQTTAPPADPLDAAISDTEQQRKQRTRAAFLAATGAQRDPDAFARAQRLARSAGLPVPVVARNFDSVQRRTKLDELDAAIETSPVLAAHMQNPDFAGLSHDDTEALRDAEALAAGRFGFGKIGGPAFVRSAENRAQDYEGMSLGDTLLNSFRRGVPALKSLLPTMRVVDQAAGLAQMDYVDAMLAKGQTPDPDKLGVIAEQYARANPEQRAQMRAQYAPAMRANVIGAASELAPLQAERNKYPLPGVVNRAMQAPTFGEALDQIMTDPAKFIAAIGPESLVQTAPGLLAAIPAGMAAGPGGAATTIGGNSFLVDYASQLVDAMQQSGIDVTDPESIRAGLRDPEKLAKIAEQASEHASVVAGFDALSGGIASRMVLPKKVTSRLVGRPLAQEMANIALQVPIQAGLGAAGEAGGEIAAGQDIQPGQVLAEAFGEFFGTPSEVVTAGAGRIRENLRSAQHAEQNAVALQRLSEVAKASKTRNRDPQTFADFVDAAAAEGPVQDVFISAQALMQSGKAEAIAQASPAVAEQLPQALESGGDVRIPLGEFAANLAGKDFAEGLLDHLKTSPDGMSRAEALAFYQSEREQIDVNEVARQIEDGVRSSFHAQQVHLIEQEVAAQLDRAGRFSPAVNRVYAALPSAFFDVMAQRLGVNPAELWQAYGANVSATPLTAPSYSALNDRGVFVPRQFTKDGRAVIGLRSNADLSTFLHESGHWFLESYADMAKAAPVLQGDMQALLNWFGVPDLATWQGMSLEQKRAHHEQFARGFEAYLFEGRAPSVELQSLFQRFRAWLARVYRSIKGLNVELNDEVRAVLDRMLATDAQIAEAQRVRALSPLFGSAEQAAAFGVDWAQYQALGRESTDAALARMEARSMRDMTYTSRLREETVKHLNREAVAKRKELRATVETELQREPVYAAQRWLKRGEMTSPTGEEIKATAGHRLSIAALKAMYPEGALDNVDWQRLGYGGYGMLAEEGLHPDLVAEMFGFPSGDALVRAILAAPDFKDAVEGLTDQRMLEQFGDLSSPDAIRRAADEAIHSDVRDRFLATELAGLQQATGGARVLAQMAKEYAAKMIERATATRLRPAQYAAADARAGKAAETALRRGDVREAIKQKRFQLIQHAATRAAYEAQAEVQKTLANFSTMANMKTEELAKVRNLDIANTARAILAAYGIGPRNKNPRAYMEAVKAYDPELFGVLEPMLLEAEQIAKPIGELTVGELRALRDNIESLWYLARRERQVEIDGELLDRQQVSQQLAARLDELGTPLRAPGEGKAVTEGEKRLRYLAGARAALRRVEHWVDRMDAGDIRGVFRRYVFQPVSEAADHYRADAGRYLKQYRELLSQIEPGLKPGRIDASEIGYTFGYSKGGMGKAELLHAILHTGNESNKRKLLLGRGWAEERADGTLDTGRWDRFIRRMIREGHLTKADFDFAQGVWDLLEQIKPLAQRAHREAFGRYFDEITAQEFATPFGVYRGGYVPAVYDTFEVQEAAVNAQLDALNGSNQFMFPAAQRGFTKGRVEYNRPLALDLRLLASHIDKALLFAHLEMPVRDVVRTLRAKGFAGMLNRYDPTAYTDLLLPWLNRAAKQTVETPATGWGGKLGDRFFRAMRRRAGMAAMFANVTNALQQLTGLSITALKVKPSHLKAATWRYLRAPQETAEQIAALSPFMANRQENEVMQMRQEIDALLLNPSAYEKTQAWTQRHAYFLQSAFQNVVDTITWSAAFDQATAQGYQEADAVRAANAAVRETQGSLQPEDISRFESGPAFVRLFTQFQGYFNMQANLLGTEFAKVAQEVGLRQGAGRLFYVFLFGFLVPAWVSGAIVRGMRGELGGDGDDEYLDDFLAFFFGEPARNAAAMVPIVGQSTMLVANSFNRKPYDDRMSTAPAVSMIESAASAPHSVYKAIAEEGKASRAVRDTLTLVSLATGIPVTALGKPLGYAADVGQGKVEPTGPVDAVRGAVSGAASPGSRR